MRMKCQSANELETPLLCSVHFSYMNLQFRCSHAKYFHTVQVSICKCALLFPSFTADGPAHWEAGPATSTDAFIIAATHQHPCLPTAQVTPLIYFLQTVKLYPQYCSLVVETAKSPGRAVTSSVLASQPVSLPRSRKIGSRIFLENRAPGIFLIFATTLSHDLLAV